MKTNTRRMGEMIVGKNKKRIRGAKQAIQVQLKRPADGGRKETTIRSVEADRRDARRNDRKYTIKLSMCKSQIYK